MKQLILLFTFLCISVTQAQLNVGDASLDFGEDISKVDGDIIRIAGVKNGAIYTLAKKGKKYFLQTFDASSKKNLSSLSLKLDKLEKSKVSIKDVVVIGQKAYVMASYYVKSSKNYKFVALEIAEDLSLGKPITLLSVETPSSKKRGAFLFEPSYDNLNYMVSHVRRVVKKELLEYQFVLLDGGMSNVATGAHTENFQDRKDLKFDFSDYGVNEHGDVFIALSDSYRDKKSKTTRNRVSLHTFYANKGYKKDIVEVNLEGKKVVNCKLLYTSNNTLQLVGFYSKLKKSGKNSYGLAGIFDISINTANNTVKKKTFNDFTFETKKKLIGERRANKGKSLIAPYRITDLIERDGGGVIVLAESLSSVIQGSSGSGAPGIVKTTTTTYRANEIIVTALKADGTLDWSNVIPKEQELSVTSISLGLSDIFFAEGGIEVTGAPLFPIGTMGDGPEYLSSMPLYKDGKLSVIINDDPKNVGITDIDDVKKVRKIRKMIPVAFEFDDATGKMTRVDQEDFEKKQIVLRPGVSCGIGGDQRIIYGSNRAETCLGVLTVD